MNFTVQFQMMIFFEKPVWICRGTHTISAFSRWRADLNRARGEQEHTAAHLATGRRWTHTRSSAAHFGCGLLTPKPLCRISLSLSLGFLIWLFFYPFTTQQDEALERQPLDKVTQFFAHGNSNAKELELFSAEGWGENITLKQKNVSSSRGQAAVTHRRRSWPAAPAPGGPTVRRLPEQSGWPPSPGVPTSQSFLILLSTHPFEPCVRHGLWFFANLKG